MRLEELLPLLQCPHSRGSLQHEDGKLVSSAASYAFEDGIPDLRVAPSRLVIDLPWVDVAKSVGIESGDFEYLPNFSYPPDADTRLSALVDIDGRGKRVLDVGCGTRACQKFFESQGFQYVAVDYEKRGVGPDVLADGHRLPFKDGVFDMYYSNSVYEHLMSPFTAALEAKRVLKKGGVFWGSTAFMYGFHDHASYFHMSHAGVLLMLKQVGFANIKLLPGLDYPWAVAASVFGNSPGGWLWEKIVHLFLWLMENSFVTVSNGARILMGRKRIDRRTRKLHLSGGVGYAATVE